MTRVVNCKTDDFDVYIGRPSKWGNPFKVGRDGTRKEVIEKYKHYVLSTPKLLKCIGELRDQTLGCWCKPLPCHGDVLVELVEAFYGQGT